MGEARSNVTVSSACLAISVNKSEYTFEYVVLRYIAHNDKHDCKEDW